MSYSNSSLVKKTILSPNNYGLRSHKIDTITPHCVVGHCSLDSLGAWFARSSTGACSNYGVDDNGNVGMFAPESIATWCSSNFSNDNRAVTIEIASDVKDPYAITNKAMDGAIKLMADICKRNGIPKLLWHGDKNLIGQVDKQNITVHRWFSWKTCPGDYIYGRLEEMAAEVNKLLVPSYVIPMSPTPSVPTTTIFKPYTVRIKPGVTLNYRKGPGTNYAVVGQVKAPGVYTIVMESMGPGSSKWGKLKSGAGWVALDYCVKVG